MSRAHMAVKEASEILKAAKQKGYSIHSKLIARADALLEGALADMEMAELVNPLVANEDGIPIVANWNDLDFNGD